MKQFTENDLLDLEIKYKNNQDVLDLIVMVKYLESILMDRDERVYELEKIEEKLEQYVDFVKTIKSEMEDLPDGT